MKTTRSLYFLFTFSNARINAFFVRYVDLKATNKERRRHVVLGWGPHVGVVFVACSLAKNLHLSVEFYLQTLETMMHTMRQHLLGSVATIHLRLLNCHFKLWRKACCCMVHWCLLYPSLVSVVCMVWCIGVRASSRMVHRRGGESAFVWCQHLLCPRLLVQVLTKTMTSRTTHQPMKWAHKLSYLPEFGALQLPHHSH